MTVYDAISDLPEINPGEESNNYKTKPINSFQADRRANSKYLSLHKSTCHSSEMIEIIKHSGSSRADLPEGMVTSGFSSSYSRLVYNEPSVTLTVNFVHPASNRCIHPEQNRALTPREGARIQSFDDDFIFKGSRTKIVKQIGNAVPPLLGRAIAEAISVLF